AQSRPGGMAQIYDKIAAFARRVPAGAAGTMVTEQLLSGTGLLNMQGLSPTQQAGLIASMRNAPPGQAYAAAQAYIQQTRHQRVSQARSYTNAALGANQVTPPPERLWTAAQNVLTGWINAPRPPVSPRGVLPGPMTGGAAPAGGISVPSIHGGMVPITKQQLAVYSAAS